MFVYVKIYCFIIVYLVRVLLPVKFISYCTYLFYVLLLDIIFAMNRIVPL